MEINNEKTTIKYKLRNLFLAIVTGLLALFVFTVPAIHQLFGIPKHYLAGILLLSFLIYYVYQYKMDYFFIFYSDETDKLIFRFFPLRSNTGKKHAFEIPKETFYNYEIEATSLNGKEYLHLFSITAKGVAKFPPISISALSLDEKKKLTESLNKYRKIR